MAENPRYSPRLRRVACGSEQGCSWEANCRSKGRGFSWCKSLLWTKVRSRGFSLPSLPPFLPGNRREVGPACSPLALPPAVGPRFSSRGRAPSTTPPPPHLLRE